MFSSSQFVLETYLQLMLRRREHYHFIIYIQIQLIVNVIVLFICPSHLLSVRA